MVLMKHHTGELAHIEKEVTTRLKGEMWYWIKLFAFVSLILFLTANIAASQTMPSLYYDFVNDGREMAYKLLQKIKRLPEYNEVLATQKILYGNDLEAEVEAPHIKRKEMIAKLESALKKGQKGRDILYALYLLHSEEGNYDKAQDYLKQAQEIDPLTKE